MKRIKLALSIAGLSLAVVSCGSGDTTNDTNEALTAANGENIPEQTIAAGLDQDSRFFQAAKAAGLEKTLSGPGPYTVLVPTDQAFESLPEGRLGALMQPQARAELTELLTYHILPGTVLVEDIGRAIENSDGRAILATMGGETLTATRDGDRIVLSDESDKRATIVQGDQRRSNGVVHSIDALLVPGQATSGASAE